MDTPQKKIRVDFENAPKLRQWLAAGRKIAVWSNKDLSSHKVGDLAFSPGDRLTPPHWQYGTAPDLVTDDASLFEVETCKEIKRIKARRGPPAYGYVSRADYRKLQDAISEAGEGAFYQFDHSNTTPPWMEVIILKPDSVSPLL